MPNCTNVGIVPKCNRTSWGRVQYPQDPQCLGLGSPARSRCCGSRMYHPQPVWLLYRPDAPAICAGCLLLAVANHVELRAPPRPFGGYCTPPTHPLLQQNIPRGEAERPERVTVRLLIDCQTYLKKKLAASFGPPDFCSHTGKGVVTPGSRGRGSMRIPRQTRFQGPGSFSCECDACTSTARAAQQHGRRPTLNHLVHAPRFASTADDQH